MRAAALLALLTGCMTLGRVNGARTLDPGQVEFGVGMGLRAADDPLFPVPLPHGQALVRIGLVEDLDLGLRGYVLGSGIDLRYRFYQRDRLHLAVNPGVGGLFFPNLLNAAEVGGFEASLPLLAEVELSRRLAVSGGPHLTLRDRVSVGPGGPVSRFDLYAGLGLRTELRAGLFVFGLAVDGVFAPTRHTRVPGWVLGFDTRIRTRNAEEAARRQARRDAR